MTQCQWSQDRLCQIYRLTGTDTKPTCDGRHCVCLPSRGYKLDDIRDPRPTPSTKNNERSKTVKQSIPMSLAKKGTITAKIDLSTGATDYELKLIINTKPEVILALIRILQADAPVMLDFTSPQMELGEVAPPEAKDPDCSECEYLVKCLGDPLKPDSCQKLRVGVGAHA